MVVLEDEKVAVHVEVHERIQVHAVISGQKLQRQGGTRWRIRLWVELVVGLAQPADDDGAAVGELLVGGVPAVGGEHVRVRRLLRPVAGRVVSIPGARGHEAHLAGAVAPPAGLHEGAVGSDVPRRAPGVGEDGERAEGVGGDVVLG